MLTVNSKVIRHDRGRNIHIFSWLLWSASLVEGVTFVGSGVLEMEIMENRVPLNVPSVNTGETLIY